MPDYRLQLTAPPFTRHAGFVRSRQAVRPCLQIRLGDMRNLLKIAAIILPSLMLVSCSEGGFSVVDVSDPNPAWVTIEVPTSDPTISTPDNSIFLGGSAFVSDGYFHGPPWDSGVAVSWSNDSTGGNGSCLVSTEVLFPFVETKWSITIPLNFGINPITITAYEYMAPPSQGYRRSRTVTVTRN